MRARNMQRLTDDIRRKHPGATIYGIGDRAHQLQSSDHNEDDTPGVRTPQVDADALREHRAIDIMVGPRFSTAAGHALVAALLGVPANRARLSLVIFAGFEYSARNGFRKVARSRDRHDGHVHVSGLAADDDNEAPWTLELSAGGSTMAGLIDNAERAVTAFYTQQDPVPFPAPWDAQSKSPGYPNPLVRLEGKVDALQQTLDAILAALKGVQVAGIDQEQVDAAVLQALGSVRFDTRAVVPGETPGT